jgi:hypothetical protein
MPFEGAERHHVKHLALLMAALIATRHTTPLSAWIAGLGARGQPARVALVAAMRKLLTVLNAMARTEQRFEPGGSGPHPGVVPRQPSTAARPPVQAVAGAAEDAARLDQRVRRRHSKPSGTTPRAHPATATSRAA